MEKVFGLSFTGWEQFPVMGWKRKSLSQNLAEDFIPYFIYSAQPSWTCSACQDGSGGLGRTLPGPGEMCPKYEDPGAGWAGGQPHTQGTATLPGTQPCCAASVLGSAQGLGRISRRREDGGAEDGLAGARQAAHATEQLPGPAAPARHLSLLSVL